MARKAGDPGGRKLEGKLAGIGKRNPATVIGLGGALVVVVVALARRSAGGGGAAGGASDQLQQYGPGTQGYYDSVSNDLYNSIEGQLQSLETQIEGMTPPPPAASGVKAKPPALHPKPVHRPVAKHPTPPRKPVHRKPPKKKPRHR